MDGKRKTGNGHAAREIVEGLIFDPTPLKHAFQVWGGSYAQLGHRLGVSGMTARNLICGRFPTSKNMKPLADVLGVRLRDCWSIAAEEGIPA